MQSRGFFGVGVQEISKEHNLGNLMRSAHSFGASFFFTLKPDLNVKKIRQADTSGSFDHMPYYEYDSVETMALPKKCQLVGVELTDEAIDLPVFRHPLQAAYILGPEMGSLSDQVIDKCDHVIKIPMKFCVNVGIAGAIIMYDRLMSLGRYPARPPKPGGPDTKTIEKLKADSHQHGPRRKCRTGE